AILSETYDGGIGSDDFFAVGGGESAHIAFDPDDPTLVYATTIGGTLTEYNADNELVREIKPYPEYVYGRESKDFRYRSNWNAPVTASPQKPGVIYYGTQKVLRTKDRGASFEEISPDLTKNERDKQGLNGGPITVENVGAEFYGTILTITASPHEYGTIWVGSDDGLVHVTRDDGETWQNVTPGNLRGAMVNAIDVSPHEPGSAYIAVTGYKLNDFRPYIYKLTDYGRRSKRLDRNLPKGNFIRVVREDPKRRGLLYAGGEGGMYVSFDDGAHWQVLDTGLPPVPVTDLMVRQGDLVAATQGRGFWVLDDLSPLRQASAALATKPLHVFTPGPVEMLKSGGEPGDFEAENPPRGAVLRYHLRGEHAAPLQLEISDGAGNVVRRYSSEEGDFERCVLGNSDQREPFEVKYPSTEAGANQWVWDMRRGGLHCIEDIKIFEGFGGALVPPGAYTVKVSSGGFEDTIELTLVPDRRFDASAEDFEVVESSILEITNLINELIDGVAAIRKSRAEIEALMNDHESAAPLQEIGGRAVERLSAWEKEVYQVSYETGEDEDNLPGKLISQVRHLLYVVDSTGPPVAAGALERLADLKGEWAALRAELDAITSTDIAAINQWARDHSIPHISLPN
ncbi:MAG: glycosyl hydrolase, partial [Deltaproteobacteria bacterium]|nr:glycosyl hydrolase [Deltaproteobacteria bacterium]